MKAYPYESVNFDAYQKARDALKRAYAAPASAPETDAKATAHESSSQHVVNLPTDPPAPPIARATHTDHEGDPDAWADQLLRHAATHGFPRVVIKGPHLGATCGPGEKPWRAALRGLGAPELADVATALEAWRG